MDSGLTINVPIPIFGSGTQHVEVNVDTDNAYVEDAAKLVNSIVERAHNRYNEQSRVKCLKRRRTDDDLQRDRRERVNENIDFCLAGATSRSHFRMRRGDPLRRSLETFAEQKGKQFVYLRLFYGGRWIPPFCSAADIGLESGESLDVYELIE